MKTITYTFRLGQFVKFTQGAFIGIPGQISKLHVSTITGFRLPAYRVEFCNAQGEEQAVIVRDNYLEAI